MKIYLARHCRTNYNDLGLCNADPAIDVHLTPAGIEQAKELAKKFSFQNFAARAVSEPTKAENSVGVSAERAS